MQKRVAVCMGGNLRTWKYTKDNILKFFGKEVDYFMYTWDVRQEMVVGGERDGTMEVHPVTLADMKQDFSGYNLVDCDIANFGAVNQRLKESGNVNIEPNRYGPYVRYKSLVMKAAHEMKMGFEYDIVLFIRPDAVHYCPELNFDEWNIEDDWLYAYNHTMRNSFANHLYWYKDLIFYGTSSMMDALADSYQYLMVHDEMNFLYDCAEHTLGDYVKKWNVEVMGDAEITNEGNFVAHVIQPKLVRDGHGRPLEWFLDMDEDKMAELKRNTLLYHHL